MCHATPTHTHTQSAIKVVVTLEISFTASHRPFPPCPTRPVPACKLIHLRVVAGLQRDLVIVSPPPSLPCALLLYCHSHPSYADTLPHSYPIIVVAFAGPPTTGSGPAAAAAGSQQSFRVFAQLGLICKVMRRARLATLRLSLVNRMRSSTYIHFHPCISLCVCMCLCLYVFCGLFVSAIPQRVGL